MKNILCLIILFIQIIFISCNSTDSKSEVNENKITEEIPYNITTLTDEVGDKLNRLDRERGKILKLTDKEIKFFTS